MIEGPTWARQEMRRAASVCRIFLDVEVLSRAKAKQGTSVTIRWGGKRVLGDAEYSGEDGRNQREEVVGLIEE